ncbi:MAG TPA: hypothetical protein VNX61_13105, partial [Rhizomicrobium sp.]|nr:hypothetical protein [Rhizomicrobium sp.]
AAFWVMTALPASLPAILRLTVEVLAGAAIHILTQFSLWIASGRPDSAETMVLKLAGKILRRLEAIGQRG